MANAIGDQRASAPWGCMVEDFLASDLDDGSNIVDDYLKRRGRKESVPNKRYLISLRSSVLSLYEVRGIVRDQSFLARDLLRDSEPVRGSEKSGTHSLKQWDRLAARIVKVGPKCEMAGGTLVFSHALSEVVREGFAKLKVEFSSEARGGTISATTRSRSATSTVSPPAAGRTYSPSLFFSTFRPTARMPRR